MCTVFHANMAHKCDNGNSFENVMDAYYRFSFILVRWCSLPQHISV